MKFIIKIDEYTNRRIFKSEIRFNITLKQVLLSLFRETEIKNCEIGIGETSVWAEDLRNFLYERELKC